MNNKIKATFAAILGAAALSVAPAQAEDTLVINSFGGSYERTHQELVIKPFEEKYGVTVKVVTAYSSDVLAQLRAQKDNPTFDVVHFSGGLDAIAADEGLLAPIEPGELSNHDQLYPFAVANMDKGIGPMYKTAAIGLLYNTDAFETAPDSWMAITSDDVSGHVVLTDAASNTYGLLAFLMMNKVNGGSVDNIQPGLDFVSGLLDRSMIVSKSPEIQQIFAQGNGWVAPYAQDYAHTLTKAGLPIAFAMPKEGAVAAPITVNLVKGAKNRDLALKFIDFSIRAEASKGWAEALRYSPTNKTVVLEGDVADEVVYGEEQISKLITFSGKDISEKRGEWTESWKRIISQ